MTPRHLVALAALALLACRKPVQPPPHRSVQPPVGSANGIPAAPLSGTLRGAPFVMRDARYIVDKRVGYSHIDFVFSASASDSPCGPVSPAKGASVWVRLDGLDPLTSKDQRIDGDQGPWTVHYQVFDGEQWVGVSDASAIFSYLTPAADGRLTGGLAVCFSDEQSSCVSGSFEARSCPPQIDQPVRGGVEPRVN